MTGLLTTKQGKDMCPITLIAVGEYKGWLKKQSARVVNWLEAQAFKPKAGGYVLIPAKDGGLERVVVCLSEPASLWDLAALPRALPKGLYSLDAKLDEQTEGKLYTGWLLGGYAFHGFKSEKGKEPLARLYVPKAALASAVRVRAEIIGTVRDLITTPASHLGPEELVAAVKEHLAADGVEWTEIVGEALLTQNYPAIHEVGKASPRKPRLIDVSWGNPKHPRVTLVGKGVVFDTGGLDIKPSGAMYLMRKDMAGAAVALGVAMLVIQNKLPVRLRLMIPAVENSIAGNAFRPSDIIKMRNGATVEVGNTDAEGRLILADALSEAAAEKPDLLIDFSTLTGAARTAVGTGISAFFTSDKALARDFEGVAEEAEDPVWRLPLFDGYDDMLKSSFADMNSAPSSPYAGAITAALFLQRFVGKAVPWIHLDFMGWNLGSKAGRPEGGEAMSLRAVYGLIEKRFAKR